MKVYEILTESKTQRAEASKPRNFVAKNAIKTNTGAGAHKDKKRADKQGDVKHKAKQFEQGVTEGSGGDQYKIKSIGHDSKGDYYVSPSTGKKVYKSGVKRGDHENPKTGEHKSVAEGSEDRDLEEQRYKFQRIKFRGTDHDIGEERYRFAIGDNPMVFTFSSDEDNPDPDSPSFEEILARVQRDGAVEHFRITPAEQQAIAKKIEAERRKYLDQRKQGVAEGELNELSFEEIKSFYVAYKVITEWGIPLAVMATIVAGLGIAAAVKLINQGKNAFIRKYREIKGTVDSADVADAAKNIKNAGDKNNFESAEGVAEGERRMSRAAKGYEKYGKAGMTALAKAGRDGASEEKLDKIRDRHDKYDNNRVKEDGSGGATAGSTSAANVGVGAVYKNKKPKMQKPGTNALDVKGGNLMTGTSIRR